MFRLRFFLFVLDFRDDVKNWENNENDDQGRRSVQCTYKNGNRETRWEVIRKRGESPLQDIFESRLSTTQPDEFDVLASPATKFVILLNKQISPSGMRVP